MSESAGSWPGTEPVIKPAVTETIAGTQRSDDRFSSENLKQAARRIVEAWAAAAGGDDAQLAELASPDVRRWLFHPSMERWHIGPEPRVSTIEIWDLRPDSEPPALKLRFRCAGRQLFDDPASPDQDTEFIGLFELALGPAGGSWQLAAGYLRTIDQFYGYVFTSRQESVAEYHRRTGSAAEPVPAAGPVRRFRITSGFAEHNEKIGDSASVEVDRKSPPARDEAEKLIWPAIDEVTTSRLGPGEWWPSMNWLDVIELLTEPPPGQA
jgi:hypothetical protein